MRSYLFLVFCLLFPAQLFAAEVSVSVSPNSGAKTQTFILDIQVSSEELVSLSKPQFAETNDFAIIESGTSLNRQTINGKRTISRGFQFNVYANKNLTFGTHILPTATIRIEDKEVRIPKSSITLTPQQSKTAGGLDFKHSVDKLTPYLGEQITYSAELVSDQNFLGGQLGDISPKDVWVESFGKKERREHSTQSSTITSFQQVFIPLIDGKITIPGRQLFAEVRSRATRPWARSPFDSLLNRNFATRKNVTLFAQPFDLEVRDLPPAPNGAGEYVPTGRIYLKSKISKKEAELGESLTLTLTLSGTGNLRPYSLPSFEKTLEGKIKIYEEDPVTETKVVSNKILFKKIFTFALVPQAPGAIILPKIDVHYFNPTSERYEIVSSDEIILNISGTATQTKQVEDKLNNKAEINRATATPKTEKTSQLKELGLREGASGQAITAVSPTQQLRIALGFAITGLVFASLLFIKRRRKDTEAERLSKKAAAETRRTVEQIDSAEKARSLLETYFRKRFYTERQVVSSLWTPNDIVALVRSKANVDNESGLNNLKELLRELEAKRFSSINSEKTDELKELVLRIVDISEECGGPR